MHRLEAEDFTDDHISVVFPDTGALTIPGLGTFIAAGPIIDALQSAADERSAGIASGLIRLGLAAVRARRCQEQLEDGHFLLSIHATTSEQASRAKQILADMGALDICAAGEDDLCAAGCDGNN